MQLKCTNASVKRGELTLSGIDFTLSRGSILGIVGKSGSGKSTLLYGLLGKLPLASGSMMLEINGKPFSISSAKTFTGYSPQENALFSYLTVAENIRATARLYGVKTAEIEPRMNFLLKRLDLVKAKTRLVKKLSGGMQKRLDLACTLIHDPDFIVLDEPFNGLDVALQKFLWQFLHEIAESGKIIVVSSHMIGDIETHCNEYGLLYNGKYYNTQALSKKKKTGTLTNYLTQLFEAKVNVE